MNNSINKELQDWCQTVRGMFYKSFKNDFENLIIDIAKAFIDKDKQIKELEYRNAEGSNKALEEIGTLQKENKQLKSLIQNICVTGIMDWKEPISKEEMELFIKVRKK